MIIFYCHRCGKRGEFEKKEDMKCNCGYYADNSKISDGINMRKTLSGTTQMEFREVTMEQDIAERNNS